MRRAYNETHFLSGPPQACEKSQDQGAQSSGAREAELHAAEHCEHGQPQDQKGSLPREFVLEGKRSLITSIISYNGPLITGVSIFKTQWEVKMPVPVHISARHNVHFPLLSKSRDNTCANIASSFRNKSKLPPQLAMQNLQG